VNVVYVVVFVVNVVVCSNFCRSPVFMWNSPKTDNNRQLQEVPFIRVNPNHLPSSMRFSKAADVLQRGIGVCEGLPSRNFDWQEPTKHDLKLFKKHYGFDQAVLARIWHDMGEIILLETGNKDKTEKGFEVYSEGYEELK
jgi:hypothetical protein